MRLDYTPSVNRVHSVHCGINPPPPPSKTPPLSFLQSPPLNRQTVQALSFYAVAPSVLVFREPPP